MLVFFSFSSFFFSYFRPFFIPFFLSFFLLLICLSLFFPIFLLISHPMPLCALFSPLPAMIRKGYNTVIGKVMHRVIHRYRYRSVKITGIKVTACGLLVACRAIFNVPQVDRTYNNSVAHMGAYS